MTELQRLGHMLNKAIKMGWEVNGTNIYCECSIFNDYAVYYVENPGYIKSGLYSYHHLFSKDSGLMEFVEWKPTKSINVVGYGFGYLYENSIGTLVLKTSNVIKSDEVLYHYYEMASMTDKEKIIYFVNNAIIPGQDKKSE